ncbi:MAG: hypothetical protein WCI20_04790 [bacterium]
MHMEINLLQHRLPLKPYTEVDQSYATVAARTHVSQTLPFYFDIRVTTMATSNISAPAATKPRFDPDFGDPSSSSFLRM